MRGNVNYISEFIAFCTDFLEKHRLENVIKKRCFKEKDYAVLFKGNIGSNHEQVKK